MYLIVVDTMQIQPYIFGSNRLRENLGASYLVAQATGAWAKQYVPKPNNLKPDGTYNPFTDSPFIEEHIEKNEKLNAEVIYAGGGNFVALIREKDDAERFVRGLSRQALTDAPGLQLLIDCHAFEWSALLVQAIRDAFKRLAEQKRKRTQTAPLLGLGVTVPCQGTGLPAVEWVKPTNAEDEIGYPASAEICAKLNAVDDANDALADAFGNRIPYGYEFPYDLDHMGRSEGEFSHIAIVHADGDSMSERFHKVGEPFSNPNDNGNRKYIDAVRSLSETVKEKSRAALGELLTRLARQIDEEHHCITYEKDKRLIAKIEFKQNKRNGKWWLPFRPIVWGGDDVTFVCDGRLGLALAAEYLKEFNAANQSLGATACAGIAIIKTHYPFARGYALAEELCQSAKKYRADSAPQNACMDWHFALSGLAGDVDEIREREYKARAGWLHLRPVALRDQNPPPLQSWQATEQFTRVFQGKDWMTRRNKTKALRDALRQGATAVKRFRSIYEIETLPGDDVVPEDGWIKQDAAGKEISRAVYFDALELADWYVPLEK